MRAPKAPDWPNGLYDCPSFKRIAGHQLITSYAYNFCGVEIPYFSGLPLGIGGERLVPEDQDAIGPGPFPPNRESEILQPSDMITFGDGHLLKTRPRPDLPTVLLDSYLDDPLRGGQEDSDYFGDYFL